MPVSGPGRHKDLQGLLPTLTTAPHPGVASLCNLPCESPLQSSSNGTPPQRVCLCLHTPVTGSSLSLEAKEASTRGSHVVLSPGTIAGPAVQPGAHVWVLPEGLGQQVWMGQAGLSLPVRMPRSLSWQAGEPRCTSCPTVPPPPCCALRELGGGRAWAPGAPQCAPVRGRWAGPPLCGHRSVALFPV